MNTLRLIKNDNTHEAKLGLPVKADDLKGVFMELLGRGIASFDAAITFSRHVCNQMPFGDEIKTCPLLLQGYCSGMNPNGAAQLKFNLAHPKLLLGMELQNLPETISDEDLDELNRESPNCSMVLPSDAIRAFKNHVDDDNLYHRIRRGDI